MSVGNAVVYCYYVIELIIRCSHHLQRSKRADVHYRFLL